MEYQISEETFAGRRRVRMEKLRILRSHKFATPVSLPSESYLVSEEKSNQSMNFKYPILDRNDKAKNRQIKNRESALLSRKRKIDEMSYLHNKVRLLEEEVFRLKSRLHMYEGDSVDCPMVIVPNSHDADTESLASTESEKSSINQNYVRGGKQIYPYSGRNIYQSSNLKMRNDGGFTVSNNGIHQYPNNKCLSHLEPAVFI